MSQTLVLQLGRDALTVAMLVSGPVLVTSLVVGVAVSIFQAVTQIQEMTLTFVPKIVAVSVVILMLGPWMLNTIAVYTTNLLVSLPSLAR